mmetsp:Transcript_35858/g.39642  ORF Transcript_35858/g.39642 Transcript_35858/m.39642 type:complete len:112 (+) Transcript_35858:1200-1535(+)
MRDLQRPDRSVEKNSSNSTKRTYASLEATLNFAESRNNSTSDDIVNSDTHQNEGQTKIEDMLLTEATEAVSKAILSTEEVLDRALTDSIRVSSSVSKVEANVNKDIEITEV